MVKKIELKSRSIAF